MNWQTLSSVGTFLGVIFAAYQIGQQKRISQSNFEDSLDQQYRSLIREIPVDALIGQEVEEAKKEVTREAIYNYLDLCNEQVYLRKNNRITRERWLIWQEGIEANLNKIEFQKIYKEVYDSEPDTFTSLFKLTESNFLYDPKKW